MLPLESPRWSSLTHAYGSAGNIPALLAQLAAYPSSNGTDEPWLSPWSALAHQGDVYPASFAAVPHIAALIEENPASATADFFHIIAWIEICRQRTKIEIPADLNEDYFSSLAKMPVLAAEASVRAWDDGLRLAILASIAASKGSTSLAEAILELTPDVLADFQSWFESR